MKGSKGKRFKSIVLVVVALFLVFSFVKTISLNKQIAELQRIKVQYQKEDYCKHKRFCGGCGLHYSNEPMIETYTRKDRAYYYKMS